MTAIPRRTPKEFAFVIRKLGLDKILLVEGPSDRLFYRLVLDSAGVAERAAVHAIGELDVPVEWLDAGSDHSDNRRLVVSVCIAREAGIGLEQFSVRGVIDLDLGVPAEWLGVKSLLVTDVPALESYCFTAATLEKLLRLVLHDSSDLTGSDLVAELTPITAGLIGARRVDGTIGSSAAKVVAYADGRWSRSFSDDRRTQAFDRASRESAGIADPREVCYGHDLAEVLIVRFANRIKNYAGIRSPEALERTLLASLELEHIRDEPLFLKLCAWAVA